MEKRLHASTFTTNTTVDCISLSSESEPLLVAKIAYGRLAPITFDE
jgi:hypothetical protein